MSEARTFTFADAQHHATCHVTRGGGEPIELFQLRQDKAACALLRASRQTGSKLHRFLVVTHRFYTATSYADELKLLTGEVLLAAAPPAPNYTLSPVQMAG